MGPAKGEFMKILITGTSRGIGQGLVQIAKKAGNDVIAVDRKTVDLRSPEAAARIAELVKPWGSLDLLINNAGIFRKDASREDFAESFLVNSIVPFEITQALLPYLKKSQSPRVVQVTSKMGSIEDATSGGYYAYRSSKTALNMINKCLATDNPWLTTVVVHPGWVKTDMGGAQAPTSVDESTRGIWKLIEKLGTEKSGHFFDFESKEIPW